MRILIVDTAVTGHHLVYLENIFKGLSKTKDIDIKIVLPEKIEIFQNDVLSFPKWVNKFQYLYDCIQWISTLNEIKKKYKPDIIHILASDPFYQHGGIYMENLKTAGTKVLTTQHHIPKGKIRLWLLKRFAKKVNKIIVHTEYAKQILNTRGINNIEVIDYPAFHKTNITKSEARIKLGLPKEKKILLFLGGTRYEKGLDILINALNKIQNQFYLVIAGKEEYFSKSFIEETVKTFKNSFFLDLRSLSNNEFGCYVDAADCVIIPYRKIFDGASGPMAEAIWRRKPVIGPSHGSLNYIIGKYKVGLTFISEDVDDLARVINNYFERPNTFNWTGDSEKYRIKLDPAIFVDRYIKLYSSITRI